MSEKLRATANALLTLANSGELENWVADELAIEASRLLTLADQLESPSSEVA